MPMTIFEHMHRRKTHRFFVEDLGPQLVQDVPRTWNVLQNMETRPVGGVCTPFPENAWKPKS